MPREVSRDVTVGDYKYQILKMDALTGSWVAMQLFTKMLPGKMEAQADLGPLPENRSELSRAEFDEIQALCLGVCRRYNEVRIAEPVFLRGKFVFHDLQNDVVTVIGLTLHALIFNVKSFFEGGALDRVIASFKGELADLNLPNASK